MYIKYLYISLHRNNNKMKNKILISATINISTKDKVAELAKLEKRSISNMVDILLLEGIKFRNK